MIKKLNILIFCLVLLITASTTVMAAPAITVTCNGAASGTIGYNLGSIVIIAGHVYDNEINAPLPNVNVSVDVTYVQNNAEKTYFHSVVKSDSNGDFRTVFTLSTDSSSAGTYKVKASGNQANASISFILNTSTAQNGLTYLYSVPTGPLDSNSIKIIPVDTKSFALVFSGNVNYFYNKNSPVPFMGENENNADCISMIRGDGTTVPIIINLISDDAVGSQTFTYRDASGNTVNTQNKDVLFVALADDYKLAAETDYKIKISGDMYANNGTRLGQDLILSFKTDKTGTIVSSEGIINTKNNPVKATDVGTYINTGSDVIVEILANKVADIIKDKDIKALSLDLTDVKGNTGSRGVKLSKDIISLLKQEKKSLVIQDSKLAIVIPPEALDSSNDLTLSSKLLDMNSLPKAPSGVSAQTAYEFIAQPVSQLKGEASVCLPIPEGIANPELLGVYYLNESAGKWEYAGGRIIDGKLVFTAPHFSKYMVSLSTKTFADISKHWAKNYIEVMAARQIISGVSENSFAPERYVTRAEFATLISKALKLTTGTNTVTFKDVDKNAAYANYVYQAAAAGLITGWNGNFRPDDKITREEMASIIYKAYKYSKGNITGTKEFNFNDSDKVSPWAREAVKGVSGLDIINGRPDGSFGPLDYAKRADSAVMLSKLLDKLN